MKPGLIMEVTAVSGFGGGKFHLRRQSRYRGAKQGSLFHR
jgi:hypothetical protein